MILCKIHKGAGYFTQVNRHMAWEDLQEFKILVNVDGNSRYKKIDSGFVTAEQFYTNWTRDYALWIFWRVYNIVDKWNRNRLAQAIIARLPPI